MSTSHSLFSVSLVVMFTAASCGQAPSFVDSVTSAGKGSSGSTRSTDSSGGGGSGDASGKNGGSTDPNNPSGGTDGGGGTGGTGGGGTGGGGTGGGGTGGGGTGGGGGGNNVTPPHVVPGADPGDNDAIQRCLLKWKNLPFGSTITNYKRIYAAVSVGGSGVVINDTAQTSTPQLILVDAGVNVLGTPVYNLRNQNGYYCMKVNVNVLTSLTVNLACNARLADSLVQVNVNSTTNSSTSAVGVNVGSNVTVNTVDQTGQSCHQ